jgi:hypothetical protein
MANTMPHITTEQLIEIDRCLFGVLAEYATGKFNNTPCLEDVNNPSAYRRELAEVRAELARRYTPNEDRRDEV